MQQPQCDDTAAESLKTMRVVQGFDWASCWFDEGAPIRAYVTGAYLNAPQFHDARTDLPIGKVDLTKPVLQPSFFENRHCHSCTLVDGRVMLFDPYDDPYDDDDNEDEEYEL